MVIILTLLICGVVIALVARRFEVPDPVALVIGGFLIGFLPGLPTINLPPDILLAAVLPPILFQAALFTSWREFRANLRPIFLLAIGLTLVTTIAVAVVAKLLLPGMPWAVCFVLGAIVSPPDAVAATAVMQRLRLPKRIVAILEGESLVNDAAGLVFYRFAVAAVLTGSFSLFDAGMHFVVDAIGGILFGLAMGWLFNLVHKHLADSQMELTLSLVLPFATYLLAETIHVSSVLAVVAAGLLRGWYAPELFGPQSRIQAYAMWNHIGFLLNSLIFIFIGLTLNDALDRLSAYPSLELAGLAIAVSLTAILVRFLWVFPASYISRWWSLSLSRPDPSPPWQHLTIISWSGMRGIVSLVAAVALPVTIQSGEPFPYREMVIFLSFAVILATLVLQGLTLAPLIRRLGVGADCAVEQEELLARLKTTHAGLVEVERLAGDSSYLGDDLSAARTSFQRRLRELQDADNIFGPNLHRHQGPGYRELRLAALGASRKRLIKLRRDGQIGDEVMHRIERELDLDEMRLG
jgi:monovalent cation/hydrogen antiporter